MSNLSRWVLLWAPRVLSIAFIAFISLFALDVFGEGYGFWATLLALTMHLTPSLLLSIVLILAWRWEWIGAVLFAAAGVLYVTWALSRPIPATFKAIWILTIAGPAFLVGALFLTNWLKRRELRARPSDK